jgi:hypothetical protein
MPFRPVSACGRLRGSADGGRGELSMKRIALATAMAACLASPALGWGNDGHKVIGTIAMLRLQQNAPGVLAKIDAILAGPDDPDVGASLPDRATWADAFRDSSNARKQATREWHFVDVEIDNPDPVAACFGNVALPQGTPAYPGAPKECVVNKVNQFRRELAAPATDPAERKRALLFLLHFVGDLHQPLHGADRHDQGGNAVPVVTGKAKTGIVLHSYWDTSVVHRLGSTPETIAAALNADISDTEAATWAGTPSDQRSWDWARESFETARDYAYGRLPATLRSCKINHRNGPPTIEQCHVISSQYALDATGQARARLQRAGVRLAAILQETLQ